MIEISSHTIDESLLPERPVVLDVGARNFGFTKALLDIRPHAIIHALEPDPTVQDPGLSNVTLYPLGLVHDDRKQEGYASFSTGEGNYLVHLPWKVADAKITTVETTNLQSFMLWLGVWHWDLIKFDCEGAEFLIMENWPSISFTQITVEFHDFNTLELHNDDYYRGLWEKLGVNPMKFDLTSAGPGIAGHWDCLLVKRRDNPITGAP